MIELWQAVPHTTEPTWGEAVLAWCTEATRSESELLSLRKFAAAFPDRPLSGVTPEAVDAALAFCKTDGTYMRYRAMIAAVLNLAKAQKRLAEVPLLKARRTKKAKPRVWLTEAEWHKLRAELPRHLLAPATFAVETGLRMSNVLGLTWDRVDLARKLVWVEGEDTKSGAAIAVPLSDGAVAALHQAGTAHGHVFLYRGKLMRKVKAGFKDACARAGVPSFTWHGLRHTWATWHIQRGTPIDVLQKLGGWADLRMVMNYAHHSAGHLAAWVNRKPT